MRKGFTLTLFAFLFSVSLVSAQTLEVTFGVTAPSNLTQVGAEIGIGANTMNFAFQNGDCFAGEIAWAYAYTDSTETMVDSLLCVTGPMQNADEIAGKFALIRRGGCFFSNKIYQAQEAGAIGAVICNHTPGDGVINMAAGGDFEALDTIPSIFLSFEDCALIDEVLAAGEKVEVKAAANIATFLDAASSYSYHTPASQIIPLDAMTVTLANPSTDDAVEGTATATITEPDGTVVERMVSAMIPPSSDTILFFPEYTPGGAIGMYSVDFTSNLSDETLSQPFVITDYTFAPDNGVVLGGVGPSDDQFINSFNLTYQSASLCLTGENGATATHATFGIANAEAVAVGDASSDIVNVILYQADVDGDGVIDLEADFNTDLNAIAFGEYILTGGEGADELLTVELTSLGATDEITMEANAPYYIAILYDGTNAGTGIAPQFLATSAPAYPPVVRNQNLTTPLILDQLYTGWAGSTLVTRLQLEGYVGTSTFEQLETAKLNISPNPASEFVNIDFDLEANAEEVRVRLLSFDGKLLRTIELENILKDTYQLDVQDLTAGTYFLSIATPEGFTAKKLIVAK